MKPLPQEPFAILPSRFLLSGLLVYFVLELLAAMALQYIPLLADADQAVILTTRLLELCGFILVIRHFALFRVLGLTKPHAEHMQLFVLLSGASVFLAACLYLVLPGWFSYIVIPGWLHGFGGFFLMVLLAPVVEEFVFRGLLYRMLRERWGIVISVLVSAVFFSLIHHGMIISPQLAGGIIFAVAYEWSRSLWVSIALHMGANAAVYALATLQPL